MGIILRQRMERIRDFIHIKDIVNGHIKSSKLLNGNKRYNVINLGSGKLRTVLDLIRIFEKVSKAKFKILFKQKRQEMCQSV